MAIVTTLAEFTAARLDEDEANVANAEEEGRFGDAPWTVARDRRELTAKRVILAEHQAQDDLPCCKVCISERDGYAEMWADDRYPCRTLRAIASVWSDHPDYDQEWAR